ncbi:tRNA (adenosine(37)-N6)-dimethylallyltransferase MiaA [Aeromicrobium sp.]|nr:tRNA (adenosine(37)-N6)-dimethylallyltransferase MiaA [Candidatus Saccharibacteria bacterium]
MAAVPLLVIVGETASGKSALAFELAKKFNGEIICADSWTVYKHFDIGTAKPSTVEQATVPHHLLNVAEAIEGFNAVIFQELAFAAIQAIGARGKLPILVGGTGLYIDSVIYEYEFLAAPPVGMREELNKMTLDELLEKAAAEGLSVQGIDTRNKRRVIRLIENEGRLPARKPLRETTLILGMSLPKDELRARVERRVDAMIAAGLEDEVRQLATEYGWDAEPMKGIGYWQWKGYFQGTQTLAETRARIIKGTTDLAKRQRTWFKRNESIQWLATEDKLAEAVDSLTTFLNKHSI